MERKTGIAKTGIAAMVALGLVLTVNVSARQYTWTGAGADPDWTNAENWLPVGVPGKEES